MIKNPLSFPDLPLFNPQKLPVLNIPKTLKTSQKPSKHPKTLKTSKNPQNIQKHLKSIKKHLKSIKKRNQFGFFGHLSWCP
jgi:hypothetical protein